MTGMLAYTIENDPILKLWKTACLCPPGLFQRSLCNHSIDEMAGDEMAFPFVQE
jgi:hypothetical protein